MKLVFVCHGIGNGGAERVFTTIVNHLCSIENEVMVITTNPSNNDYYLNHAIKHVSAYKAYKNGVMRVLARLFIIRNTIKDYNPDCVVSFSASCNVQVLLALILTKHKVIVSERTDPSRYPDLFIYRALRLLLYPNADKVVFQTKMAMDYFGSIIKRKGVIIANPIRDNLPAPQIKRNSSIIIGVGSLCEQKNWFIALDACEIFFKKHPNYTLELYGEGVDRTRLTKRINDSTVLSERVLLKGFCDHVEEKLKKAKIYISSSDYEGISNSMLEALALGTPSICTDCPVGGAREMIEDGKNGILVPVGDSVSLANALDYLATNEDICLRISQEAIKIREKYSEQFIVGEWVKLIERTISD